MKFSVIYSFDMPRDSRHDRARAYPPGFTGRSNKVWQLTERDESYECGHLEGRWAARGVHRKLCAILDKPQFEAFVKTCGLTFETAETGGSIGAPGFGYGWAPAVAFTRLPDGHRNDYMADAYVTPLPCRHNGEPIRKDGHNDRDWRRLARAMKHSFR